MNIALSSLSSIDFFKTAKYYHDIGLYDNEKVAIYVYYQKITPEQYKTITGEDYLVYLQTAYKTSKIDKTYLQNCVTKGLITQAEYNIIIA